MNRNSNSAEEILRKMEEQEKLRLKKEEIRLHREANERKLSSNNDGGNIVAGLSMSIGNFIMRHLFKGGSNNSFIRGLQVFLSRIMGLVILLGVSAIIIATCLFFGGNN